MEDEVVEVEQPPVARGWAEEKEQGRPIELPNNAPPEMGNNAPLKNGRQR